MTVVLTLIMLLLASPALAWNEPDNVHGVPWGATQDELRLKRSLAGDAVTCPSPQMCVTQRTLFDKIPVKITYLFPNDGKLAVAMLTFRTGEYVHILDAFVGRFGQPEAKREEAIEPQACTKAVNEIADWSGERVTITLRQYATKTEGRATIVFKSLAESPLPVKDTAVDPKRDG